MQSPFGQPLHCVRILLACNSSLSLPIDVKFSHNVEMPVCILFLLTRFLGWGAGHPHRKIFLQFSFLFQFLARYNRRLMSLWIMCGLRAFWAIAGTYAVRYGTSSAVTRQLQMVLNAAARMVVDIGKYTLHRCFATLFTGCQWWPGYSSRLLLWPSTVSEVLVPSTSSKSSAQSRTCHVDHFVRLAAVTCSFRGLTRPLASEVSPLQLLLSGISRKQFRSKLKTYLFRQVYTAYSSENVVEECNL